MNNCLPVTGISNGVTAIAAGAAIVTGVVAIVVARRRGAPWSTLSIVAFAVVAMALIATTPTSARAGANCVPPSTSSASQPPVLTTTTTVWNTTTTINVLPPAPTTTTVAAPTTTAAATTTTVPATTSTVAATTTTVAATTTTVAATTTTVAATTTTTVFPGSDRRLKRDVTPLCETANGIQLYSFRYLHDSTLYVGVMAQDLLTTHPDAVIVAADGYYRVDYAQLGIRFQTFDTWSSATACGH